VLQDPEAFTGFKAKFDFPPMVKCLALPSLIPGLASTPVATNAEKPVINSKR
jgi:hypothetical protein